ncbi:protein of unknown function [Cyanobium sp. NIES-981]|nr:protein of unknown function [Cyanobium sp. NIES-981]
MTTPIEINSRPRFRLSGGRTMAVNGAIGVAPTLGLGCRPPTTLRCRQCCQQWCGRHLS